MDGWSRRFEDMVMSRPPRSLKPCLLMREQSAGAIHDDSRHAATIAATAIAVPPHTLTRDDVKTYIRKVFDVEERRLDAMMSVIDNAQVHTRRAIFPVDYIVEPRSLRQT